MEQLSHWCLIFTVLSFRPLLVHGLVAAGTRSCAPSHRPAAETDLAGAVMVGALAAVV